jgi:hypothetical protein
MHIALHPSGLYQQHQESVPLSTTRLPAFPSREFCIAAAVAVLLAAIANSAHATLIAADSFWTSENGQNPSGSGPKVYDDGNASVNVPANRNVVAGTTGFNTSEVWFGQNTSHVQPDNDLPFGAGLTHSLLDGELDGSIALKIHQNRVMKRRLGATVPDSASYYLSTLLYS